jgi:hypothetical protein
MVEVNMKAILIIGCWSIICTAAIVTIVMWAHGASTREMRQKIDELATILECKDNDCDRFKGKDAKALEKRLMTEIATVKKDCCCD